MRAICEIGKTKTMGHRRLFVAECNCDWVGVALGWQFIIGPAAPGSAIPRDSGFGSGPRSSLRFLVQFATATGRMRDM